MYGDENISLRLQFMLYSSSTPKKFAKLIASEKKPLITILRMKE